jgi:hypothetical protein
MHLYAGSDSDGEQSLSKMFFEAKSKGISEDSYADWQAIVAKECESDDDRWRNFSFKASKRIFRIELARGDYANAKATFERLVSFIPRTGFQVVLKTFSSRKPSKNLLHAVCPELDRVPYLRQRSAIEKTDDEIQFILSIYQTLFEATKEMHFSLFDVFKACSLRLAKLLCCLGDVDRAIAILVPPSGLLSLLPDESGKDLQFNAKFNVNQLIELYALLAAMHCDRQEWQELESVVKRVRSMEHSAIGCRTDIALIRECEGILCSKKLLWNEAFGRFHESFTLYSDRNHAKRYDLLMICVIVGCLTDGFDSEMAVQMVDAPEPEVQANDTVRSVMQLCKCFRSNDLRASEAALQGAALHFISSQFFLSSIVDRILMPMRSKVHHLADPYYDHLTSRLVCVRRVRSWSESAFTDARDCIAANCRFILQAESFLLKSAHTYLWRKKMLQELPFPTPFPFSPVLCSEVSHASVLRHVRCGQDSLVACLLASAGGVSAKSIPSANSILRCVQDINARVHRHHRGQMLKTIAGLKQTVVHNGYAYKSFAGNDPYCQQVTASQCGNVYPVDLSWELCHPNNVGDRCLCSKYYRDKYYISFEGEGYECMHYKRFSSGSQRPDLFKDIYAPDAEHLRVNHARIPLTGHDDPGYGWEPLKDVSQYRGRADVLLRRRLHD